MVDTGMVTDEFKIDGSIQHTKPRMTDYGVNANLMQLFEASSNSLLGKNNNILDDSLKDTGQKELIIEEEKNINLFNTLEGNIDENEDAFEICDEE